MTDERRTQIIRLLQTLNDGLPEPTRRDHSTAGFVNELRSRTCPDCLANGRVMKTCETCGGSGTVEAAHVDRVAAPDVFPDDGDARDPYAVSETVQPFGVADTTKLGHVPARDAAIDRVTAQLRDPFKSLDDELDDANRNPFPWERERAAMRRRFDIDALLFALDVLRDRQPGWSALIHSVYVYREPWELSATVEATVELALRFINDRMPDPMRAPGDPLRAGARGAHERQTARRNAA